MQTETVPLESANVLCGVVVPHSDCESHCIAESLQTLPSLAFLEAWRSRSGKHRAHLRTPDLITWSSRAGTLP